MIILSNQPKVLLPIPKWQWRSPSQAQPKDQFGNDVQITRFSISARLNDGYEIWKGWFDDRDDADAFLYAAISGTLKQQPALWRLSSPAWAPSFHTDVTFYFAVNIFLTSNTVSNWIVPLDWNQQANKVQIVGAGGGGGSADSNNLQAGGGGGGAYATSSNLSYISAGNSVPHVAGAEGAAGVGTSGGSNNGGNGSISYFYSATTIAAAGGSGGQGNYQGSSGGAGGKVAASYGSLLHAGGPGGNGSVQHGGGAAGPSGAGLSTGAGDNGVTAYGGAQSTGTGTSGTQFDSTHGCGAGGGQPTGAQQTGGAGGNYGGGGAGAYAGGSPNNGAAGSQGLIYIKYSAGIGFLMFF